MTSEIIYNDLYSYPPGCFGTEHVVIFHTILRGGEKAGFIVEQHSMRGTLTGLHTDILIIGMGEKELIEEINRGKV